MLSITHGTPFQKLIYNRKAFDNKDFSPNIAPKADEKDLIISEKFHGLII